MSPLRHQGSIERKREEEAINAPSPLVVSCNTLS